MKSSYLLAGLFCVATFTSCISDEAPNAEADIEYCVIKDKEILKNPADTLLKATTANNRITVRVRMGVDLTAIAPEFRLTPGATITPASGSVHDFSNDKIVEYTVTSEDKQWQKTYRVNCNVSEMATEFHFESFELNTENEKFYQWFEFSGSGAKQYDWATGNPGFKIAKFSAKPMEYPTTPYSDGYLHNAVKLETLNTGGWGSMMHMRIAAGNLFMGTFDVTEAIKGSDGALRATNFGLPFNQKPTALKGWYKFKAGEVFKDKDGNVIDGKRDVCDIYGVFYENTDADGNSIVLNGANVLTSPNIVALARIKNVVESDEWTQFELPFDYDTYAKYVDNNKLLNYKYNLGIVFASSIDGAYFEGAEGSTLLIDEVSLVCDKIE